MHTHFILGQIGPPFGLKGFVKVKSFSGEISHFLKLDTVTLKFGLKPGLGLGLMEESRKVAEIVKQGNSLLMRFEGIDSPEAAGELNGAEIIAEREKSSPLGRGEFYIEDLKGLKVITKEGKETARIIDVVEGGGGYLAELKLISGKKQFVPFRNEFFGEVDIELGKIMLMEDWILEP